MLGIIATVFSCIPIAGLFVALPFALVGLGVGAARVLAGAQVSCICDPDAGIICAYHGNQRETS